jgi:hypothetical protein
MIKTITDSKIFKMVSGGDHMCKCGGTDTREGMSPKMWGEKVVSSEELCRNLCCNHSGLPSNIMLWYLFDGRKEACLNDGKNKEYFQDMAATARLIVANSVK